MNFKNNLNSTYEVRKQLDCHLNKCDSEDDVPVTFATDQKAPKQGATRSNNQEMNNDIYSKSVDINKDSKQTQEPEFKNNTEENDGVQDIEIFNRKQLKHDKSDENVNEQPTKTVEIVDERSDLKKTTSDISAAFETSKKDGKKRQYNDSRGFKDYQEELKQ